MTDAYKIGVAVALNNLVSAELARIGQEFLHVGKQADSFKTALGNLGKVGLMVGVAGAVVGVAAALKAGVEEARRFQTEATKFKALGFGDDVNSQAEQFARGMKTIGTSATENMALVSDAMAVFKNLDHAKMAAPLMAQMKFANAAVYGAEGGARESKFMDMLKVIEFRGGLKSDQEFATQADFVQKVINGSRNRVDATQLLNALKTGGVALAGMGNESFYLGSEPLIQEFGGSRYGTGNMSIYQNLVQMRTTQQALTELMRLGLLDASKIEINQHTGKVKRARAGAMRGADVLTKEGDLAFLEKVLLPAFARKGITSDDQIIMELGRILTNRTGSSLLSRVYQQRQSLHTQMEANRSALGIAGLSSAADQTYDGKVLEMHAKWASLMKELGDRVLPTTIKAFDRINGALDWLVKLAGRSNDDAARAAGMRADPTTPDNRFKAKVRGWFGDASNPIPANSNASPIVVQHETKLDGRVLAKSTTRYQVEGVAGVSRQTGGFDGNMALRPVQ